jgi:hypothetical protein
MRFLPNPKTIAQKPLRTRNFQIAITLSEKLVYGLTLSAYCSQSTGL